MAIVAFVSGANGYIAQHLVKLLLSKNYEVVGSIRSEEKGQHLKKLFNTDKFSYIVVPDIVKVGAFDEALEKNPSISVVFHTASPVIFVNEDIENKVLKPAIEGTRNVLNAIKVHGKNVKRVILTSSFAAVSGTPGYDYGGKTLDEDSWTDITRDQAVLNGLDGYRGSKTFAEKAAWEFVKNENPHYEFSVVNPSFVFGPQAFDSEVKDTLNFSSEIINQFLKLKLTDDIPQITGRFVDVRDIAKAHLIAAESKEAVNQRLLLSNGNFNGQVIANIIRKDFPQLRNIPEGTPATGDEFLNGNSVAIINDAKSRKILGFEHISLEQSIRDSLNQIIS